MYPNMNISSKSENCLTLKICLVSLSMYLVVITCDITRNIGAMMMIMMMMMMMMMILV